MACLAAAVVFFTTYALILPAVTMEKEPCQISEHVHTDDCYILENGELVCTEKEDSGHQHTDDCYEQTRVLACGEEEHTHTEECTPVEASEKEEFQPEQSEEEFQPEQSKEELLSEEISRTDEMSSPITFQADQSNPAAKADQSNPTVKAGNRTEDTKRLYAYAEEQGSKVEITISDSKGQLEADAVTGEYDVKAGETYNVRVAYTGDVLEQGRYYVTFASNIDLTQNGTLDCTDNQGTQLNAGRWYFEEKEEGVVWLVFDITGDLSNHSNIVLTADVTCKFDYVDEPVKFDGNITVNIKHNEETSKTDVSKWASGEVSDQKINWRTQIDGNSASRIVGNTITDTITTPNTHYFAEEDKAAGISFEATRYKPESAFIEGNIIESHRWTVRPEDSNLAEWTETGWKYTMPQKITCEDCNQEIELGNDDWRYYLRYTSTVKDGLGEGFIRYENKASIDGDESTGRTTTGGGNDKAAVVKTGTFHHDNNGDADKDNLYQDDTIDWTLTVEIPGAEENSKYDYGWHLWDTMIVKSGNKDIEWDNPLQNITVTAVIGGKEYTVPQYDTPEVTNSDCPICWRNTYSSKRELEDGTTIYPNQEISFYSRCQCTETTCADWKNGDCNGKHGDGTFCECWCLTEDATIIFQYSTPAGNLTTEYGGQNAGLVNSVDLNNLQPDPSKDGAFSSVKIAESEDGVPIPGVFTKQLTDQADEANGYLAEYTITVNEAMADLGSLQDLTIEDTMTKTLAFMPATLKIQAQDAKENSRELTEGEDQDYTILYDPSAAEANKLTIKLNHRALGAYKYTLIYDASVSGNGTAGITYENDASVKLFGQSYTVDGGAVDVPEAVISAETYGATLYKYDVNDYNKPLGGATFGLYTESGVLIHTYTTAEEGTSKGIAQIATMPEEGVILHPHVLYYVQELAAPKGYQLDDTKHYFWFCNNKEEITCSRSDEYGLPPIDAKCVYSQKTDENIVDLEISNREIKKEYELPETGGSGNAWYMFSGSVLIAGSLICYIRQRRKKNIPTS